MKRLKYLALVIVSCLFLAGCSCQKTESYTVTFDSDGGSAVASLKVNDGNSVSEPSVPTKDGYTFDGWYLGDVKYDFATKVSANITLKAHWVANGEVEPIEPSCTLTCGTGYTLNSSSCTCVKNSEKVAVTSISLSESSLSLTEGDSSDKITVTINPSNATNTTITWKSSNTKVATVKNGVVTAVAKGTATITATVDGKSATLKVTVSAKEVDEPVIKDETVKVSKIALSETSVALDLNGTKTATVKATVTPSNATNKAVTWKSSNESVATVDSNGKITAKSVGSATITATAKDGSGKSATVTVSVKDTTPAPVEEETYSVKTAVVNTSLIGQYKIWIENDKTNAKVAGTITYSIPGSSEKASLPIKADGSTLIVKSSVDTSKSVSVKLSDGTTFTTTISFN